MERLKIETFDNAYELARFVNEYTVTVVSINLDPHPRFTSGWLLFYTDNENNN